MKFPDNCLHFRLELVNEFTKIVPSAFGLFIGHHHFFSGVKSVLLKIFFCFVWYSGYSLIWVLPLCRKTGSVFYIRSRPGNFLLFNGRSTRGVVVNVMV